LSIALIISVAAQAAVVGAAAAVLLLRVAGVPAWDGTYAEDNGVFLVFTALTITLPLLLR